MTAASGGSKKGFRPDIQGIRGIALILVLLCHAEIPGTAGGYAGLDVFYVLSGYLITGLIVTEIDRRGAVSLARFYGRRAKRLLPLAVAVLAIVVIASQFVLPVLQRDPVTGDGIASALYFMNWRLNAQSVDYFNFDGTGVSPLQHYWSLSVEEQFYLLWPAILGAVALFSRRFIGLTRGPLLAVVALIAVGSFVYGLHLTATAPQYAYLATESRIWELAAGATLALALPHGLRMPGWASAGLALAGFAALAAATALFSAATAYPGWRALAPVLGVLAIIAAGSAARASWPTRMLSFPPLQHVGKISYSWYLWHWPAVVFAVALWGDLSWPALTAAVAASYIPALLTHWWIEEPLRRSPRLNPRPVRSLAIGVGCSLAAVLLALGVREQLPRIPTATEAEARGAEAPGAQAGIQRRAIALRPSPEDVGKDRGQLYDDGCVSQGRRSDVLRCVYGHRDAKKTVVLLGDSHALQYFPALRRLAERRDWRLVGLVRVSCVIAEVDYRPYCNRWRKGALHQVRQVEKPDLIVISNATADRYKMVSNGKRLDRKASEPILERGLARTLRSLRDSGARVVVIRDQPRSPREPAECVAESPGNLERCAFPAKREEDRAFDAKAARKVRGVHLLDPLPVLCPRGRCPAVIGNVIVYRDTYHLSATFAATLAPWLERGLREAGAL